MPAGVAAATLLCFAPQLGSLARFYNPHWMTGMQSAAAQPLYAFAEMFYTVDPAVYWIHGLFGMCTGTRQSILLLYPLLGLLILGFISSRKRTAALSLLWLFLPLPIVLLARVRIYPRYFGYFVPVVLIVIARGTTYLAGASGLRAGRRRVVLLLLVVAAATPSLLELSRHYIEPDKEQWRELTAVVDTSHQPGDLVLINSVSTMTQNPFEWYTTVPGEELERELFPKGGVLTDLSEIAELPAVTQGHDRVWIVFVWRKTEFSDMILEAMSSTHEQTGEWGFWGLQLYLFEARSEEGGP
jgi:hypothetical protein